MICDKANFIRKQERKHGKCSCEEEPDKVYMRRTIQNSEYDCLKSKAIYIVEITQSLFLYVSSEETNTNK